MKKIYTLLAIIFLTINSNAQVVISQVYGGGGNTSATYNNDFIELYNRGTEAVNINGWSVQYASVTGITWSKTLLPNVSILPGKFYLIQEAAGNASTFSALPTPDLNGINCGCSYNSDATPLVLTTGIAMSGSKGKVILVSSTTSETTANPSGSNIIDKVGFGTTPNGYEGTGPTGTDLTNSTSAQRKMNGSQDTNDNSADFIAATPVPRNSTTLSVKQNSIAGLNMYPNPVKNGNLYIISDSSNAKSVAVYDILGKQVINTKTSNNAVNVANLKSGAYIVKVTEDGKTDTRKLIIQ
jgi:predicted extracellular nuclease